MTDENTTTPGAADPEDGNTEATGNALDNFEEFEKFAQKFFIPIYRNVPKDFPQNIDITNTGEILNALETKINCLDNTNYVLPTVTAMMKEVKGIFLSSIWQMAELIQSSDFQRIAKLLPDISDWINPRCQYFAMSDLLFICQKENVRDMLPDIADAIENLKKQPEHENLTFAEFVLSSGDQHSLFAQIFDNSPLKDDTYPTPEQEKSAPTAKYRTKKRAKAEGAVTKAPKDLAILTAKRFQYSMSFYQAGDAYLQQLREMEGLRFEDGKLFFNDAEVSQAELRDLRTKEGIQNIDLMTLRFYYSLIFHEFQKTGNLQDIIAVSVPVLTGRNNPNNADVEAVIEKVQSYHNITGVINDESYYQVLNFEYYDKETNIIAFSSPYMNYVIKKVYNVSIKRDKSGNPLFNKSGEPIVLPSYSFLIDSSIERERNKAAAENVVILVSLIEQAGNNLPRIKASTLIERNVQLAERLANSSNPRILLKRTFTKTWELLRKKTRLEAVYKDIKLPDPKNPAFIPTIGNLEEIVFEFPHNGKVNQP